MPIPSAVPTFDIFNSRFGDNDVVWIECVEGLAASKKSAWEQSPLKSRLPTLCSSDHLIVAVTENYFGRHRH